MKQVVIVAVAVVLGVGAAFAAGPRQDSPFSGMEWATGTGQWSTPIPSTFSPSKDHGLLTTPAPQVQCLGCGEMVPLQHLLVSGACGGAPSATPARAPLTSLTQGKPTAMQTPMRDEVPSRDRGTYLVPEMTTLGLAAVGLAPLLLGRRRARLQQRSIRI